MAEQYIEAMHGPMLSSQCEVCRRWSGARLCPSCLARFSAPLPRCGRCGLAIGVAVPECGACLQRSPPFARCWCIADYVFPWNRLIIDFKFYGQPELADCLSAQLVKVVRRAAPPRVDIVVPVPLSPSRLEERGYNQAWEIARRVARALGIGANANLLTRVIDTPHQAALTRDERLANLRAAFVVPRHPKDPLRGRRVALVDDVMTTGATAEECARTLLHAGASAVDLWVLARTPAP